MRLYIIMMLTILGIMSCNANSYEDISYDEYKYKFINKPQNEEIVRKVEEYVNSDYPGYWSNLSNKERDIWLDYALYTGARYGYGYGTDVLGFVKVAMTAGAGFMVDEEADYEVRRIMHNNNSSEFRKIDKAIDYLNSNNFPEPKPTKESVKRVVWLSNKAKEGNRIRRKPFISMGSSNNTSGTIHIEEVVIDSKWNGIATGGIGCGNNQNHSGGGGPLWNIPSPKETIYVKWYSWAQRANIEATVALPNRKVLEELYYFPPWYEPEFHSKPESKIVIDIRPDNVVWIKLARNSFPSSKSEIMIIGEGKGVKTDEKISKYDHYIEGKDYRLDCFEVRKNLQKRGDYNESLELFDDWYPGAKLN